MKKNILIILTSIIILYTTINILIHTLNIYVKKTPNIYTQTTNTKYTEYKKYNSFYNKFKKYTTIPGLKEGGIPQAICYSSKYNILLISEYHKGGAPSIIHLLNIDKKTLIKTIILNYNNTPLTAHVGGIATNNETLWITDNYTLYEFSLDEIINANDMSKINALTKIELDIKADFINYNNDILWIGEYYYYPIYRLDETKNKDRLNNKALLIGYDNNLEPKHAYYIPDKAQGITWDNNNNLIISSSFWSFESSNIKIYTNPIEINNISNEYIKINNKKINVSNINDTTLLKNYTIPPMAEGITTINNELYIIFESASNLYKYYTPYQTDKIYKITLPNEY